jgi:3-oxoacyl-[acyl-carrier-protein] synthase-1
MESVAIERAGLLQVPVNGLKGYYGHTMGAAGILETILSMQAIDDNNILATRGFETIGVTHPLILSNQNQPTDKQAFIKLLSGFGGCNAALLMTKGGAA